jgi:hypothetical protein
MQIGMKTKRTLSPGQPGTKKFVDKYGNNLVCVRYRYDLPQKKRITTVELVVEEKPWEINSQKIPKNKIMNVQIAYGETYLQRLVKAAGGKWNRAKKAWELPYKEVVTLGLTDRIVAEGN